MRNDSDKCCREKSGTVFINLTLRRLSFNDCCSGKEISIAYSECVFVALVTQHAMRMCHIVIFGLPRSTIFFTHYLINEAIFEKKKLLGIKCASNFSTTFSLQHSKIHLNVITNVYWSSCKAPFILVKIERNLNFSRQISKKNSQI